MRVFLSYNFPDEQFAAAVANLLRKQTHIEPFLYLEEKRANDWREQVTAAIEQCDAFVYMAGQNPGRTQRDEFVRHVKILDQVETKKGRDVKPRFTLIACLPFGRLPDDLIAGGRFDPITVPDEHSDAAEYIAREISLRLIGEWIPSHGVPLRYLFRYEKDIVDLYVRKRLSKSTLDDIKLFADGCPPDWPKVHKRPAVRQNAGVLEEKFGQFRAESFAIAVDSRVSENDDAKAKIRRTLTFPEAGPRQWHRYPLADRAALNVAVLVSGGIAPGINAVIDGIVTRHEAYRKEIPRRRYQLNIWGYREGLQSLVAGAGWPERKSLKPLDVVRQAEMGGSLLPTSRWDDFLDATAHTRDQMLADAVKSLKGVDILYVIGGDGSMRAAHALWNKAQEMKSPLSVLAVPKTMDNDILWVWQSFGFLSAVEKAREAVLNMHTEAKSNPRLCILQLFGSDSGFVAAHAGLASGVCDAVLIPEDEDYTMEGLYRHVASKLRARFPECPHALIVMAETALPADARQYVVGSESAHRAVKHLWVTLSTDERDAVDKFFQEGRRVRGQTPNHLRTGGLKIVSEVLEKMIRSRMRPTEYWNHFRVFASEPRHLIRSVPPSSSDVIFAERLGALAVDNAMAGYTDCIVSQWLTEFVLVPLELVVLGRKRVPRTGVFWKSVLLSTGQPPIMALRTPSIKGTGVRRRLSKTGQKRPSRGRAARQG